MVATDAGTSLTHCVVLSSALARSDASVRLRASSVDFSSLTRDRVSSNDSRWLVSSEGMGEGLAFALP